MSKINIYLRSVKRNGKKELALFDDERNGDIDNLVTEARPGDTIIWKKDTLSGIKGIASIYSKEEGKKILIDLPKGNDKVKKEWKYKIPKDAEGEESYGIIYVLDDGTKLDIDPKIKVLPPM